MNENVTFEVAGRETDLTSSRLYRRMLVGPWVNQPEEYEGYNGFVGWAGLTRLRSGRLLVAFTSGYWHGSTPWTEEIRQDPACRAQFEYYRKLGCPDIRCPDGGRAHVMHSDDEGLTWSKPATLINTDMDDRHPTILELDDGTLLCPFMAQRLPLVSVVKWIRSTDGGQTWSPPRQLCETTTGFSNGPMIQLRDGTVVLVCEGAFDPALGINCIGVFRSTDRGQTFTLDAVVKTDHEMNEPTVAETAPGRLVMMTRRRGDVSFSDDGGCTWTAPVATGVQMSDPHLLVLPNGVLACFHGGWGKGGVCAILSRDGGRTWRGPAERFGYWVVRDVYGYCHPIVMPDGTVLLVAQNSGGHTPADARTMALWLARVRVRDDADGIEILPAPGSPAALRRTATDLETLVTAADDLRRGELKAG